MRNRTVRPAAVAGRFYLGEADGLRTHVESMLAGAGPRRPTAMSGVIVPHAGHIYSGPVAAHAYRLLPVGVERVVLVGPSHFVPLTAMAATGAQTWRTPLGDVPIDTDEVARLTAESAGTVVVSDPPHSQEHCLEVQLPFLQLVLEPGWRLVPFVVGHLAAARVAEVLELALARPGTLLVVSTDLSHYLPYEIAAAKDARTADAITSRDVEGIADDDACGAYALRGALHYATAHDLPVQRLDVRSSGDTAGTRDRVVGYGSFVIAAPEGGDRAAPAGGVRAAAGAESDRQARLLALARRTIEDALRTGRQSIPSQSALEHDLQAPGAAFVTLRSASTGELLGCVGSMEANRPLGMDVAARALDAAFHDTRFRPLTPAQAHDMRIDISVLGPLVPFPVHGYDDLVAKVPVGEGLFVYAGGHRATYLPAVWQELTTPQLFVASLWRKAGLAPGMWPDGMHVYTYQVAEFAEP